MECFLWAILGAVVVLVAQTAIVIWLKFIIIILILAAMVAYCFFTCRMPVKNIDEYSKVSAARQDTVPKPMVQNNSARITREVRPEVKRQQAAVNANSSIRPPVEQQSMVNTTEKRHIKTIVLINEEACIGCQECVEACPFGAMQFNEETEFAVKCDMCIDRDTDDG